MSTDARLYMGENGWSWAGTHDGPCIPDAPDHAYPGSLPSKILELEECLHATLRWEIEPFQDTYRLSGWIA